MLHFSSTDTDDKALSEEERFYYLRLMAKPSKGKNEPIKTKFVRWSLPCPQQESLETDRDLESQAMRVVRTIGQAFEVCHKVAQEQMQEKYQEDSESSSNIRVKNSLTSTEGDHIEIEEKLAKVSEASRSPSPTDDPPPLTTSGTPVYLQKRHSIFGQRKSSDAILNPSAALEATALATTNAAKDCAQASTSGESQKFSPIQTNPLQQSGSLIGINPTIATSDTLPFVSGSSTLPHSMTWGPQMTAATAGQFQSMQTLDQRGLPTMPYYPMPIIGPSASMPYGLSSPYLLSPYATLPLPGNTSSCEQQPSTTNSNIPGSPLEGQHDLTTYQLSLSLDQYNQHLIRSQLDQAQQTAQVASCQVQLLRDQLTSETTARIEAQSRTHQLLNANRELLEQVQALVLRLQSLETKLAEEIQEQINQPSTSKGHADSSTILAKNLGGARQTSQLTNSLHEQFKNEAKVPGPPPLDPSKPYQLQSLADIRAGSLPPQSVAVQSKTTNSSSTTKNTARTTDDYEARTEPESGTEDTTDYSSSDQYEKVPFPLIQQQKLVPLPEPHLNVLMSNPQVLPNLSSFFSAQSTPTSDNFISNYLAYPVRNQNSEINKDDEEQQNPSSTSRRIKERSKTLKGGALFKRMSFNPKLWETKRGKDMELISTPTIESIDECQQNVSKKLYEKQKGISKDDSVDIKRKRSDRLQTTISMEPGTSSTEERCKKLSDTGEMEMQIKMNPSKRRSLFSNDSVQLEPASMHLATAMYPPRRMDALISNKAQLHSRVSQDVGEELATFAPQQQPTALIGNGPIPSLISGRQLANHIGALNEKEKLRRTSNSGSNQILMLQEALKHSLANTKQQLIQSNETLDGMRGSLRYMESEKQKLGDPMVLAKLTKLPTFMSTGTADSLDETNELSPTISGGAQRTPTND
ncbi:conserved hypothetical protein,hypothetical protein [Brugia malayi]|uniref:Uncharacterized protein n=4 Tax=Brugia malayi TaxID=6279 RepID=A0A4E9EZR5_BRUMA|nr:conserved hypothetical protein,hypothetical protein [Brugia malayi]VIO89815.1 conserved hypothetical protein,hypothetical protein [Brugia malayi]